MVVGWQPIIIGATIGNEVVGGDGRHEHNERNMERKKKKREKRRRRRRKR